MISNLRRIVAHHLVNISGWRTNRKIVVIESDDWGSIRMPSRNVYDDLLSKGVPVDKSPYCRYDSLASESDLAALFDKLNHFKDSTGRPPVITANSLVANPDFDRIKKSNFNEYYFEEISKTFKRYHNHDKCLELWLEGKQNRLFYLQSHGREHVNIYNWLKLLRNDEYDFRLAFEHQCWGLSSGVYSNLDSSVQAAFDLIDTNSIGQQKKIIQSGLRLFKDLFGYSSESFIYPNYTWASELDDVLKKEGVKFLQGMKYQKLPRANGQNQGMIRHYLGEKNHVDQYYLIRNCSFEPSLEDDNFDNVGTCLRGISTAFKWKKPAIITSHRINYVGNLHESNRSRCLRMFSSLMKEIVKRWPDVEFMTSDELGAVIEFD